MKNNMSKKEIIKTLQTEGFYTEKEAKVQLDKIRFSNNNNLEKYLVYLYLNNLYDINCVIDNKISQEKFIELVFKNGFIPVQSYKSILN